jgi:hypothetical protein
MDLCRFVFQWAVAEWYLLLGRPLLDWFVWIIWLYILLKD